MTKNAIQKVLESNYKNGRVLNIKTNIATGHGLNGVSYGTYNIGLLERKKNEMYYPSYVESSTEIKIMELDDEFIVLKVIACNYRYFNSKVSLLKKQVNYSYLPLDSIVSLCYIEPYDTNCECLSEV